MPDATTQRVPDAANAPRNENGAERASMKAVGVYERPSRRAASLPKPLLIVLLVLGVVSAIIFLKSLW